MNIPNILTLIRLLLIPVIVLIYLMPGDWRFVTSALIFFAAGFTDWLDGYLARKWDQSTPFGAFFDPVADKLMVAVALVLLVHSYESMFITLSSAIIISREIVISALREWMAELGKRASVAVSFIGKFKTLAQMGAITFLLAENPAAPELGYFGMLGYFSMAVAAGLTLWSMFVYLKAAWPELKTAK
jgi:CDP-diacylglycerol--glycerol-3-phosphate 3-phosphatidyltransferase